MISNPITFFIDGSNQRSFTYEGGKHLWHFSPNQSGLMKHHAMNIIFFADDATHALDVVERICKFAIECHDTKYDPMNEELKDRRDRAVATFEYLLLNKKSWIITLAPMNQVYKVGWASNDTI